MKPKNFREYLMQKIKQTRIDQKDTIKDAKKRNDKEHLKLQNEFYSGRLFTLKESRIGEPEASPSKLTQVFVKLCTVFCETAPPSDT